MRVREPPTLSLRDHPVAMNQAIGRIQARNIVKLLRASVSANPARPAEHRSEPDRGALDLPDAVRVAAVGRPVHGPHRKPVAPLAGAHEPVSVNQAVVDGLHKPILHRPYPICVIPAHAASANSAADTLTRPTSPNLS